MRGIAAFVVACAVVCALTIIPAEHARWIALALLAIVVLTPAVGRYASAGRSSGEAASPSGERGD